MYSRMISSPMLDVNSGTSVVVGPERGQADHPQRADDRAGEARRGRRSPRSTRARASPRRGRTLSDGPNVRFTAPRSTPPSRRRSRRARTRSASRAAGDTVIAGGRELVLAHADDHAPDAGAARWPTSSSTTTSTNRHEVVVGAVLVGELERADVGPRDLHGRPAGGEERAVEDVRPAPRSRTRAC